MTLLALIAGVIGTTWQAIEARRERDVAVFEAERASANRKLVWLMLGAIGDAKRPLTPREILERSEALIEKQFTRDPRIAVGMLLHIAAQYSSQGDMVREYRVTQRAGEIAQASGNAELIADAACNTVKSELDRKRFDLAQAMLEVGQQALARIERPDLGTVVSCIHAEADLALRQGDADRAVAQASEAIRRLEREGRTEDSSYLRLLSFLGVAQVDAGHLVAGYQTSVKLRLVDERLNYTETVDYLVSRANEALLLMALGDFVEAGRMIDAVSSRWAAVTGDDTMHAAIHHIRGLIAYVLGDFDVAEREAAESFRAIQIAGRGGSHAEFGSGLDPRPCVDRETRRGRPVADPASNPRIVRCHPRRSRRG